MERGRPMSNRTALALAVAALPLLVASSACFGTGARGAFQRRPPVSGPVDLHVVTGSGDITVRTGPPGSVTIAGTIRASTSFFGSSGEDEVRAIERNPPIRQTGNTIRVELPAYDNISIDYQITVPAETHLRAETGSGDHSVRGLRGNVDVRAGSGNIELEDIVGKVVAETGSGNVHGRAVAGPFDGHTGSGDIRVKLTGAGDVSARTGSGDAEIRGVAGALAIDTSSGDVVAEGEPRSPWSLGTSSGDVRVSLPPETSFDLEVSTGSGDISVGRPVTTTVQGRIDSDDNHVAGRVGRGGPLVKVHTGSGDVHVD
jgi:Putative adhesin